MRPPEGLFADELKALAGATQVLQSETCGADGQTYSLFQENSSAALQTSTDLKGFDMVTTVRRLAEQEHSAALAQLGSCISAIMKFGAGADDDPFVKVKDLITAMKRRRRPPRRRRILKLMLQSTLPNLKQPWRDPSFQTARFRRFSQSWVYC